MNSSVAFYTILLAVFTCHASKIPVKIHIIQERSTSNRFGLVIDAKEHGIFKKLKMIPVSGIWSEGALYTSLDSDTEKTKIASEIIRDYPQVYTDEDKRSSLTITDGHAYGRVDEKYMLISENGKQYLSEESAVKYFGNDYEEIPNNSQNNDEFDFDNKNEPINVREKRNLIVHTAEIGAVVDKSFLKKAKKSLESTNKIGERNQVISYMSIFFNGIKQIYDPLPWLDIKLTSVNILNENDEKSFFKPSSAEYVDSRSTLESFANFIYKRRNMMMGSNSDIFILFTGKDIADNIGNREALGYAYIYSSCQTNGYNLSVSTGIIEDDGTFQYLSTAHEIAHILGSPHDGEMGAENCSAQDGYIMSTALRTNQKNVFLFSECSKTKMKAFVESPKAICLRVKNIKNYLTSNKNIGDFRTLDTICKEKLGKYNAKFAVPNDIENICLSISCQYEEINSTHHYIYEVPTDIDAPEGAECLKGKRCIRGHCV